MANHGLVGRAALVAALLALTACSHKAKAAAVPTSVTNPVVLQRSDPSVFHHTDGFYYLADSVPDHDAIELRRATTLDGLATAVPVSVLRTAASGPESGWVGAPDLTFDNGTWYVYYSAAPRSDPSAHRLFAAETTAADPTTGTWQRDGELRTNWDSYASDATAFTATDGRGYLVWAQKSAGGQGECSIYLALLGTPTSLIGTQVRLAAPSRPWEQQGSGDEAPGVLVSHGKVWVTYSAGATDASYSLGLVSAPDTADLLAPASWTTSATPVFTSSTTTSVYGPGSNSFTVSDDGRDVVDVYDARSYPVVTDPATDRNRAIRMQKLGWHQDGSPDFGTPAADGPTPE